MKNIHVLPTDKPSRLFIIEGKIFKYHKPQQGDDMKIINVNIYITSDEEIKEGDWCLDEDGLKKCTAHAGDMNHYFEKIILTTDQDLIADGVQDIDYEFLEWFVKNPSCEKVETVNVPYFDESGYSYLLIIPKEEPKKDRICNNNCSVVCGECQIFEPKQETLEKAMNQNGYHESAYDRIWREGVEFGANWMKERMYSEEEVMEMFHKLNVHLPLHYEMLVREMFKK